MSNPRVPIKKRRLTLIKAHSQNLNNGLVQYSDHEHVSDSQKVCYLDHHPNYGLYYLFLVHNSIGCINLADPFCYKE